MKSELLDELYINNPIMRLVAESLAKPNTMTDQPEIDPTEFIEEPHKKNHIYHVPDLASMIHNRFYSVETPRVLIYEEEQKSSFENGKILLEDIPHPKLSGKALVIKEVDPGIQEEVYRIFLLNYATNIATSRMSDEDPNRQKLIDTYGILPLYHQQDPSYGILFQGIIRYPHQEEPQIRNGVYRSMVFEYKSLFLPPDVCRSKYREKQLALAHEYLTPITNSISGSSSYIEEIFSQSRKKMY